MSFNIVFKNEMKIAARSRRLFVVTAIYNIVLAAVTLLSFKYVSGNAAVSGSAPYVYMMPLNSAVMTITAVLLSLLITPSAGGSIAGERERQTLDILLSTRLTPLDIISGKILSSVSFAILLLISGLPITALTLMYGGIGFAEVYKIILYIAFFIILTGTAGVFCSCVFRTVTSANVASFGMLLFFTGGTGLIVILCGLAVNASSEVNTYNTGPLIWVWLINPAVTYTGIICHQLSLSWFDDYMDLFGVPEYILPAWTALSIAAQTVAIILLVYFSSRSLDPLISRKKDKTGIQNNT